MVICDVKIACMYGIHANTCLGRESVMRHCYGRTMMSSIKNVVNVLIKVQIYASLPFFRRQISVFFSASQ